MSEDLENTVASARGQGPSSDFVAALRERIVAEANARPQTGITPVTELEVTPLREQGMTTTRKMIIGLVAAAIVLVAGFAIIGDGNDSDDVNITDRPTDVTSATASTSSAEPSPDDLLGTWTASFGPTWQIEADRIAVTGGAVREFSYFATDTFIQVSDDSGCPFGMYGWQIEEDVLTLTVLTDDCGGRSDNLNGATFERID